MAKDPFCYGEVLSIAVESIVCPHCDSELATIAEVLAPEEVEQATMNTWSRTLGAGGVGATVGTLGGPVGVAIGGVIGSAYGGISALRRRELARVQLECSCGYRGSALGEES